MKYILFRFIRFIGRPLFYILYRPVVIGRKNIPNKGAVILAGNHTKMLDAAIMVYAPKRVTHILAKKELFNSKLKKWFFTSMGCISVDRKNKDKEAISHSEFVLNNGEMIGIFPEGTINKTKDIVMPFKYGAVSLAKKTGATIVPFAITGEYKLFRKSIKIEYGKGYKVKDDLEKENKKLMKNVSDLILKGRKRNEKK